jgi:hypothetical protein
LVEDSPVRLQLQLTFITAHVWVSGMLAPLPLARLTLLEEGLYSNQAKYSCPPSTEERQAEDEARMGLLSVSRCVLSAVRAVDLTSPEQAVLAVTVRSAAAEAAAAEELSEERAATAVLAWGS